MHPLNWFSLRFSSSKLASLPNSSGISPSRTKADTASSKVKWARLIFVSEFDSFVLAAMFLPLIQCRCEVCQLQHRHCSLPQLGLLRGAAWCRREIVDLTGEGFDSPRLHHIYGEVAEWSNAPVSKTGSPSGSQGFESPPRLPSSPLDISSVALADTDIQGMRTDKMSVPNFEEEASEIIRTLAEEIRSVELRVQRAQEELADKELSLAHWQAVLKDYRARKGYPVKDLDVSPVVTDEYASLGPTEMIHLWAKTHGGEVVVRELCKRAVLAGAYKSPRRASSNIYAVIRKRSDYVKIGPGHFKSLRNGQVTLVDR